MKRTACGTSANMGHAQMAWTRLPVGVTLDGAEITATIVSGNYVSQVDCDDCQ